MLACLLLLCACWLGLLLAAQLEVELGPCTRAAVGVALGQVLLLWVPLGCAAALNLGARAAGVSALCLLALACAGVSLASRWRGGRLRAWFGQARSACAVRTHRPLVLAAVGFVLLFAWLLHTHYLLARPDGLHSAGVTWGDLPLHVALATRFAAAVGFPTIEHPLLAGAPFVYPFLPDYSVAVLHTLGLPLRVAFILGGLLPMSALPVLVHGLTRTWFEGCSARVSVLALGLFLLAGGLGFGFLIARWLSGATWLDLLATTNATYIDGAILKSGSIGNLFLAARTAAYGMPIGCCALLLLGRALWRAQPAYKTLAAAGLAIGALPLIHGHSFLVASGVAVSYPLVGRRWNRAWAVCFVLLALAASPQLLWLSQRGAPSFVRIAPGFLRRPDSVRQWLTDLGLGLGLWIVLLPLSWRAAPSRARLLALPLLLSLPLANVVVFTPAVYDNVKLVAWFDLGAAPLLAFYLERAWGPHARGRFRDRLLVAGIVLGCTLSGLLAVGHELVNDGFVMSYADRRFAQFVARHTRPDALIATAASYHDPVAMFSGRRVLLATPAMLGTHGIDVRPRALDVVRLYAGGPAALEVIARLGVTAVVVGPHERTELPMLNEAFLRAHARASYGWGERRLYLLQPTAAATAAPPALAGPGRRPKRADLEPR